MSRIKSRWKVLALALALVLWAAWYSRPVDIYTLAPEIKEPDAMDITLSELGGGGKDYPLKSLSPENPEWDTALEAVESLRFRRPPWNLILQFLPKHTTTGRVTHDGDHQILFSLYKQGEGYIQVQFFIDEWMYHSPHTSRYLTLWVKDSKQTGDALGEILRPLLEEDQEPFHVKQKTQI